MEENLAISSVIDKNDGEKAYDNYCKKILSNKQILAHIMKECVDEYADIPLEEIPNYIESTPETNVVLDTIDGKNLEDESIPGALIRYDVLFEAALPQKDGAEDKEIIRLFINIEAQNQDNPGYSLISRALYYCSRLLAKQKNAPSGFQHSEFGNIKKVYSIWLCFNHTKEKDDVINMYSIKEECMKNEWNAPKDEYDLMKAVMIYPGREYNYYDDDYSLLEMLNILFIAKLSAEAKKSQLMKNYGIIMTQEIEKEVITMCNLSQGIKAEGRAEGKAEGILEGIAKATLVYVKRLMQKNNMSAADAMDILDVENDIRPIVLKELEEESKK